MMHPPLPANLEEMQTSAAPDAAILEADIAALLKAAGGSLRGEGGDSHCDTEQVPIQPLIADASEPALRNTEFKVAETCPERLTGGPISGPVMRIGFRMHPKMHEQPVPHFSQVSSLELQAQYWFSDRPSFFSIFRFRSRPSRERVL
jgi:hypothetical protein